MPFDSLKSWLPENTQEVGRPLRRVEEKGSCYEWGEAGHECRWALPLTLRVDGNFHLHRILVLVMDEGSPGWSMFMWLANDVRARVVFQRDPLHRLSNLFTNAIRGAAASVRVLRAFNTHSPRLPAARAPGVSQWAYVGGRGALFYCLPSAVHAQVPAAIQSTMQVMLLHKFRRAPYGGGRFWNGLKQVLRMFLSSAHSGHPLYELLGESICNDYGTTLQDAGGDCRPLLRRLLQEAKGPRVEARRWYTIYDGGLRVAKLWHSMLLALLVWFLAEGRDPWKVVVEKKDAAAEEGGNEFDFKTQALLTLFNIMHQKVLLSKLIVFRRIWTEHKLYSSIATRPSACFNKFQRWASFRMWSSEMIAATLNDAFCQSGKLKPLGLEKGSVQTAWPAALGFEPGEVDADGGILLTHIDLACSAAFQQLLFGICPQSPPWVFALLLVPDERLATLEFLHRVWELKTFLDTSGDPEHQELRQGMWFLDWAFVSETLELLNQAEWKFEGPSVEKVVACVKATFTGARA